MFKRIVWFGSGVASGAAGSWYVKRKVRQKVERFTPAGLRAQAAERVQQLGVSARTKSDAGIRSEATERVQQLGATIRTKGEAAVNDGRQVVRRYRSTGDAESHLRALPD